MELSESYTIWKMPNLAKSLGISQLIHSVSSLDVPREYLGAVNSAIFKFIWKNKKDNIKRKVMRLAYDQGGLRAPSIYVLSKSLKLAWISRLLSDEHKSGESWKTIPNYIFGRYGGLNFILRCTVLCKSNANEIRRNSSFVLANFQ